MENITPMLKMSKEVTSLLSGTSLLKHGEVWEGCSKFCNLAKISAGREIFFLNHSTMLSFCLLQRKCYPGDYKSNLQSYFNLLFLQLEKISNDYTVSPFPDKMIKPVVLISIIIAQ